MQIALYISSKLTRAVVVQSVVLPAMLRRRCTTFSGSYSRPVWADLEALMQRDETSSAASRYAVGQALDTNCSTFLISAIDDWIVYIFMIEPIIPRRKQKG